MKAGRGLDVKIATEIMGWYWQNPFSENERIRTLVPPLGDKRRHYAARYEDGIPHWLPHYSTDIKDAWRVLEELISLGWYPTVEYDRGEWVCWLGHPMLDAFYAKSDRASLAICSAAIKAVESLSK